MNRASRRRWLAGAAGWAASLPFAGCSSEPLSRLPGSAFGSPAELVLWGPDAQQAAALAAALWQQLAAFDLDWSAAPERVDARLAEALAAGAGAGTGNGTGTGTGTGTGSVALPAPVTGADRDIAWRGLGLELATPLPLPDPGGALLTLGQHLLAVGERGFRPWHVGLPDPVDGRTLLGLDLYAGERMVTVASYARYRTGHAPDDHPGAANAAARESADSGASSCASCTVVLRGGNGARTARLASLIQASRQADWRAKAQALGADSVLWVGRDGRLEATTAFAKRALMADQRRPLTERPGS